MLMFSKVTLEFLYITLKILQYDLQRLNKSSLNIKSGHCSRKPTESYVSSHIEYYVLTVQSECRVLPIPCSFELWYPHSIAIPIQVDTKKEKISWSLLGGFYLQRKKDSERV